MGLEYFNLDEFKCKCGCTRHLSKMDGEFLIDLDLARGIADIPFKITSGYRCPSYNLTIGGKPNSAHLKGRAADIYVRDGNHRFFILEALLQAGFRRIGIGPDFIHVDNDYTLPKPWVWDYYPKRGN